nr:pentapeptide repeat-containing protein [Halomarina rubra]
MGTATQSIEDSSLPAGECGYVTADDGRPLDDENWSPGTDSAVLICRRPKWNDTGHCVWHADEEQKPASELLASRSELPERLDGAVLRGVSFDTNVSFADCSLVEADFCNARLWGVDFSDATLTGAKLHTADFHQATLDRADFESADLTRAYLVEADATGATFRYATLDDTILREATFDESSFAYATGVNTDMSKSSFENTDFWRAELRFATFRKATLEGAEFAKANLKRASMWKADLSKTSFWQANLRGGDLWQTGLAGTDFSEADLSWARLSYQNLDGVDLSGAKLRWTDFRESRVTGARFRRADHTGRVQVADTHRANFELADFSGGLFRADSFAKARLDRANFTDADLTRVDFTDASLRRADFTGATLFETTFTGADAQNASFSTANCRRTRFDDATIHAAEFGETLVDAATDVSVHYPETDPWIGLGEAEQAERWLQSASTHRIVHSLLMRSGRVEDARREKHYLAEQRARIEHAKLTDARNRWTLELTNAAMVLGERPILLVPVVAVVSVAFLVLYSLVGYPRATPLNELPALWLFSLGVLLDGPYSIVQDLDPSGLAEAARSLFVAVGQEVGVPTTRPSDGIGVTIEMTERLVGGLLVVPFVLLFLQRLRTYLSVKEQGAGFVSWLRGR